MSRLQHIFIAVIAISSLSCIIAGFIYGVKSPPSPKHGVIYTMGVDDEGNTVKYFLHPGDSYHYYVVPADKSKSITILGK